MPGSGDPPDLIFPVRSGDSNEELRFALRSLRNLPHGRVWLVGYKPSWVRGVDYIPGGNSAPWPRANLWHNLLAACRHPGVAEEVVIFNDDIYVIGPIPEVPILHRGLLADQVATVTRLAGRRGWWQESLAATQLCLRTHHPDPLSYELHTPFPANRAAMADTLRRFAAVTPHNPPQWRTLYGVVNRIGGRQQRDCKALRPGPLNRPFHSTDDLSWRYFRSKMLQVFPEPSPYELAEKPELARLPVNVRSGRLKAQPRRTRA